MSLPGSLREDILWITRDVASFDEDGGNSSLLQIVCCGLSVGCSLHREAG
jgi:hypothetical protein